MTEEIIDDTLKTYDSDQPLPDSVGSPEVGSNYAAVQAIVNRKMGW